MAFMENSGKNAWRAGDPTWQMGRKVYGEARGFAQGVNRFAMKTAAGRAFKQGFGEVFGLEYTKTGYSRGFMGVRGTSGFRTYKNLMARKVGVTKAIGGGLRVQGAALRQLGVRGSLKTIRGAGLGRILGAALIGVDAYMGYKEGGIGGAAKSLAESGMIWGGMKAAGVIIGGTAVSVATGVAAVGIGAYAWGEAATDYRKRLEGSELIPRDAINTIQGAYTDRARAMDALNNSALNARMSIGNEAKLLHSTYSAMTRF